MLEDEDSPLHGVMLITPEAITNYPPGPSEPETDSVNKNTVHLIKAVFSNKHVLCNNKPEYIILRMFVTCLIRPFHL